MEELFSNHKGNTPLRSIPDDYIPQGTGQWFKIPEGDDKGKKLFFYDFTIGEGDPDDIFFFVHGNPESSYTYRHVIHNVISNATSPIRIIALDHIGFGLSDQSDFEMVDMHHANNLACLLSALALPSVHLIVHDWGGPIGIGAFLRKPKSIKSLTVLNSTIFPIPNDGITYDNFPLPYFPWSKTPLIPDISWGAHAAFAILRSADIKPSSMLSQYSAYQFRVATKLLPNKEKAAQRVFIEQFSTKANARSSKRMVRQTPVWGHGYSYKDPSTGKTHNNTLFYKNMQDGISSSWSNIPARLIAGTADPLGKNSVIQQWLDALPQLEGHVQLFKQDSHFIEETRHHEIANTLLGLMKKHAVAPH